MELTVLTTAWRCWALLARCTCGQRRAAIQLLVPTLSACIQRAASSAWTRYTTTIATTNNLLAHANHQKAWLSTRVLRSWSTLATCSQTRSAVRQSAEWAMSHSSALEAIMVAYIWTHWCSHLRGFQRLKQLAQVVGCRTRAAALHAGFACWVAGARLQHCLRTACHRHQALVQNATVIRLNITWHIWVDHTQQMDRQRQLATRLIVSLLHASLHRVTSMAWTSCTGSTMSRRNQHAHVMSQKTSLGARALRSWAIVASCSRTRRMVHRRSIAWAQSHEGFTNSSLTKCAWVYWRCYSSGARRLRHIAEVPWRMVETQQQALLQLMCRSWWSVCARRSISGASIQAISTSRRFRWKAHVLKSWCRVTHGRRRGVQSLARSLAKVYLRTGQEMLGVWVARSLRSSRAQRMKQTAQVGGLHLALASLRSVGRTQALRFACLVWRGASHAISHRTRVFAMTTRLALLLRAAALHASVRRWQASTGAASSLRRCAWRCRQVAQLVVAVHQRKLLLSLLGSWRCIRKAEEASRLWNAQRIHVRKAVTDCRFMRSTMSAWTALQKQRQQRRSALVRVLRVGRAAHMRHLACAVKALRQSALSAAKEEIIIHANSAREATAALAVDLRLSKARELEMARELDVHRKEVRRMRQKSRSAKDKLLHLVSGEVTQSYSSNGSRLECSTISGPSFGSIQEASIDDSAMRRIAGPPRLPPSNGASPQPQSRYGTPHHCPGCGRDT